MEVKAELVSTISPTAPLTSPRQTPESCCSPGGELSTLRLGKRVSSLTPTAELKPAPKPRGLDRSSVEGGREGLGFRGEVMIRAGFDRGEMRLCWGKLACGGNEV